MAEVRSQRAESAAEYETPTLTLYGDITSLTQSIIESGSSDALCAVAGFGFNGVPSNTICKTKP